MSELNEKDASVTGVLPNINTKQANGNKVYPATDDDASFVSKKNWRKAEVVGHQSDTSDLTTNTRTNVKHTRNMQSLDPVSEV
jgi:hypothetical protein